MVAREAREIVRGASRTMNTAAAQREEIRWRSQRGDGYFTSAWTGLGYRCKCTDGVCGGAWGGGIRRVRRRQPPLGKEGGGDACARQRPEA